jgi:hypothetical protein
MSDGMRSGLGDAAYAFVRDVASNVWSVTDAAEAAGLAAREANGSALAERAAFGAVGWSVADAARLAALDAASDAVASTFGAVADAIGARVGAGDADPVDVGWSDDTDAAEDVGMVLPVVATWGDAFAVVDVWSEGPTWVATLADMLAADAGV